MSALRADVGRAGRKPITRAPLYCLGRAGSNASVPLPRGRCTVAFLQVVKGSRPGQILELRGERMVLGRHPSCEIVLDNAAVSRQHAQIINRQGTFFLEDLRSRNRTYLNGTPIDGRTPLSDADEVTICD